MSQKIFIDSSIFFYLQSQGQKFSETLSKLSNKEFLVTDVKTLQEVVYYYHLMGETGLGYEYAEKLRNEVSEVYSLGKDEINTQRALLDRYPNISPKELAHVSVTINNKVDKIICSPESTYFEIDELEVQNVLSSIGNSI